MKTKMSLFLVAIAAAGIFALPSVMATFAGSHTMENPPTNELSLDCTKCHQYIVTELNATTRSSDVLSTHKDAALTVQYTSYMKNGEPSSYNGTIVTFTNSSNVSETYTGATFIKKGLTQVDGASPTGTLYIIANDSLGAYIGTFSVTATWTNHQYTTSKGDYKEFYRTYSTTSLTGPFTKVSDTKLDANGNGIIEDGEVCKLCHMAGLFGVSGTHTSMTVVGCTNDACHGNSIVPGKAFDYFGGSNSHLGAGYQLSRKQEAHSNFYYGMRSQNSAYVSADGNGTTNLTNISADYYTCLGCHTHVGMKLSIKRPAGYDVVMNKTEANLSDYKDNTGAWVKSLDINHSATNLGNDSFGTNISGPSLNTSDISIIKDPTSVWINDIPGNENKWNK